MQTRKIIFSLLFFSANFVFAGENFRFQEKINWSEKNQVFKLSDTKTIETPSFENASFNKEMLPVFFKKIKINTDGSVQAKIVNAVYQSLNPVSALENSKNVSSEIKVNAKVNHIRKQPFVIIQFVPIRKNVSGNFEKLISFDLEINIIPGLAKKVAGKNYASNSVLAMGEWYKIAVDKDGVYKIDNAFLRNTGMDVDNINPKNIRIYGNGGGLLPEDNSKPRYDDLVENAIEVVGESDEQFNTDDYILFYAQAPDRWYFDDSSKKFYHQKHYYSSSNYYFINVDLGAGKRIQTQPSSSSSPTNTITAFDDYLFHEQDNINFIQSGREWYGEQFDNTSSQNFYFNFPNIITNSPVYVNCNLAARSTNGSSNFSLSANGNLLLSFNMEGVAINPYAPFVSTNTKSGTFNSNQPNITINLTYDHPTGSTGWLNYIELNARRQLIMNGSQMQFRDVNSVGAGNISEFILSNISNNVSIWDITIPLDVKKQNFSFNVSSADFVLSTDYFREFIAFNNSNFLTPSFTEKVSNQNLHSLSLFPTQMLIITPSELASEANRLADFHRTNDKLTVAVVDQKQIFNEFSSGATDISAVRDFIKMFYDRAGTDTSKIPKYLLLFGDGSYNNKNLGYNENNFIVTYETNNSYHLLSSYTSDDFFGFLDDDEGGNITDTNAGLDIAIGRLPVGTANDAKNVVNKIINYNTPSTFGNWRNNLCFVADDEDDTLHIGQANQLSDKVSREYPVYNADKIFLDAYPQIATPGGGRYPAANDALNKKVYAGLLILNYTGHGSENSWSGERVLDVSDIILWENSDKLPLVITATCSFSRYDNPSKTSAGEYFLLNPSGGAIGLLTTARAVFAGDNFNLNTSFYDQVFTPVNGKMQTLGEIIMNTKINTAQNDNNRKFTLLGDPAMKLAYPIENVVTTEINKKSIKLTTDTLKALSKITISGEVRDNNNIKMNNFNGILYATIFDKSYSVTTLKNDAGSGSYTFSLQNKNIYKGKASVNNGTFQFTFIVPKDIAYQFGNGKISYYAKDSFIDAHGYYDQVVIGGTADSAASDNKGPEVKLFLNDEKFIFGGLTNENPILIVKLSDENGINTAGSGIGHDIVGIMDDEEKNTLMMNDFYEAELDNYQKGKAAYPLAHLKDGTHTISVKAWDTYNNSGTGYTEFVVAESAELALRRVLNYPNPFTTNTTFFFEHNRPGDRLKVTLQIFTITSKLIKTFYRDIQSSSTLVDDIEWDGLDDFGDKIGRGVYIYRLSVVGSDGNKESQFQKLVILR